MRERGEREGEKMCVGGSERGRVRIDDGEGV